jgi:hypothetical protein
MVYGTGILSSVLLLVTSHMEMILYLTPDILDIPSTVPLYPYCYGTATYACMSCIVYATVELTVVMISHLM